VTEIHYRVVDSYGFIHLDTNRYSVPERWVGKKVAVHKRPGLSCATVFGTGVSL
jgi:hypothetical protein